jgi:hypothetical protein
LFNLVVNTASSAALIGQSTYANTTIGTASENNGTDAGDYRITLDTGSQVTTIIVLFVILATSILLLLAGEQLVNSIAVLTSVIVTFMGTLYLWQWACSSTTVPMEGFVKCILPFILACISALISSVLVILGMKKFTSLVFFIMGAAGGAVGMFLLRQFIVAGNPSLVNDTNFNLYWLALAAVALLGGVLAVCFKSTVVRVVTVVLGGYTFAVALCGLIPALGGAYVPNYGFFVTAGVTMLLGAAFQCFCCKKRDFKEEEQRAVQYNADGNARKAQGKAKGQSFDDQFVAP